MKTIRIEACAFIVDFSNHILLVKKEGQWQCPCAPVTGEKISEGLIKQIRKDLDIEIEIAGLLFLCELLEKEHAVIPFYLSKIKKGKVKIKNPQYEESRFFDLMAFTSHLYPDIEEATKQAIEKFFELRKIFQKK